MRGSQALLCRGQALVLGGSNLGAGEVFAAHLVHGTAAACRLGEHRELFHILGVHRGQGVVQVFVACLLLRWSTSNRQRGGKEDEN